MDKIGIVVLNYKSYHLTIDAIESLAESTFEDDITMEIYVVDNHSKNDSLEHIEAHVVEHALREVVDIHLIQSQINGGYAKGINQGIRQARDEGCDYIATVNPDITVKADTIQTLYSHLKSSEYGMMGPKVYDHDGALDKTCARKEPTLAGYFLRLGISQKLFPDNSFIRDHYIEVDDINEGIVDADVVSGAFMLFKCEVLEAIGLFDENTFLYNEEFIIHARLKAHGYKTGVVTTSIAIHLGGGSSQDVKTSKFLVDSEMDSLDYYMKAYRGYSELLRKVIILNIKAPFYLRTFFQR